MIRQLPLRQRVRKAVVILSFLLFPVTLNFFSPYLIVDGAANGIVNGSLVMFGLMFVSSLFLGRAWCGWVCPGSTMADLAEAVNNRPVKPARISWIKWLIWIPWISIIVWLVIRAGGYSDVDLLYFTETGVSVDEPGKYITYYAVLGLFIGLAILFGRRAGCHTVCWMAPFMIIGRWLRNRFGWPSLRLKAEPSVCADCKKCTSNCPMSLDVNAMVQIDKMENPDCILCGTCVDNCAKQAIRYSFSAGK
jgi:polyferredoxin